MFEYFREATLLANRRHYCSAFFEEDVTNATISFQSVEALELKWTLNIEWI